ncbi:cell wall metabolism sensor histidine kinase WalK [Dysgonomonas sp. 520]|uniref:sensor histidine kinase n=1 Tax=Dysgonomonas sp. 520 TaxID=2302931 RepID=UPI0013CF5CB0|nr:ATP-binding protein [Dysgonomonas sp. 520]NDW10554.1 two-component sensor histidine kinase [Dysgonomonas sp. 520]
MKLTYKQRIFGSFFIIFALFAICIIYIEQRDEKKYRTEALESKLDGYAEFIHTFIEQNNPNDSSNAINFNRIVTYLPKEIRITIVTVEGKVLYDKDVKDISKLDNHLSRPEILQAKYQPFGTNVRMSTSTRHEYLYFAKAYPDYFIRVALPYNIQTKGLMKADNMFIYVVVGLFVVVLILLNITAGRFSKSITKLKNFTSDIRDNNPMPQEISLPDDELGEIGNQLIAILKQKEAGKKEIELEREKLIQHFHHLGEGIGLFKPNLEKIYANTYFIQYLNLIANKPTFEVDSVFELDEFKPVTDFLRNKQLDQNYYIYNIESNGKIFQIQIVIYEDKSFEVSIKDVTRVEKNRRLKQEMTNNIAHELRTPVTSLRGYLETITQNVLPKEKQEQFLERAYQQTIRLSTLIEDVSLLSKVEEYSSQFSYEKVNLSQLIDDVRIDVSNRLSENYIKFYSNIDHELTINANYTLIYSIFRNLVDNTINYGGQNIEIHISNSLDDEEYVYLNYYDTGKGVPEEHLNRLFERFYRVDQGRTRDNGGSGLGLSIVKNAVLFHKGKILVKNRENGGLEFLFTLKK